jgi:hypothetical protein
VVSSLFSSAPSGTDRIGVADDSNESQSTTSSTFSTYKDKERGNIYISKP